ncbi:MAG: sugar transferase [Candidatus Omnitrophota bacterium]
MLKRAFDLVVSLLSLYFFIPIIILISFTIKLATKGPVFYQGVRVGLNGRPFRIIKFRSMVVNAEAKGGYSTALNDARLTKIGKFLRKYKLDEIPQLINVLKGEMSIVGPRPQVEEYTKLYKDEEKIILTVKPGLTDYSSIEFIDLDSILGDDDVDAKYLQEIEPKKNELRIKYVKEYSFLKDIKIIIQTIKSILFKFNVLWSTRD